jgi:predicted NBD/HSP70 family sugar kinase
MNAASTVQVEDKPQRFVGVDIGGTKAKAVVIEIVDSLPRIVEGSIVEIDSDVAKGPQYVISTVIPNIIQESLAKSGLERSDMSGYGFDFPAPVSNDGLTLAVGNMKDRRWEGFHVQSDLVTTIGRFDPFRTHIVCVENDAAAQILGAIQQLPPEERKKTIMGLFVGTGLGGATSIGENNPFKNQSGGSEPGASTFLFDEDRFLFGKPGQAEYRRLEEFVSLVGIERQLEKMHNRGEIPNDHPLLQLQAKGDKSEWRVRAEGLLMYANEALDQGDMNHFSLRIFEVQRQALGLYVQMLIQNNRVDHLFIGGGITDSARVTEQFREWYVNGVKEIARGFVVQANRREIGFPEFHVPKDGDAAAPLGAAIMAWKASLAETPVAA